MGGARTHAKSIVFASEYTTKKAVKQGSKNIKMIKDVGMTVVKSRETVCSKTGDEGMQQY